MENTDLYTETKTHVHKSVSQMFFLAITLNVVMNFHQMWHIATAMNAEQCALNYPLYLTCVYTYIPCNVTRAKMGQYVARNLQQNSSFKMKTIISLK